MRRATGISLPAMVCCLVAAAVAQEQPEETLPVPDQSPAAPEASSALEVRFMMSDLVEAGNLDAAAALQDLLLELTEAQFGPESDEAADAWLLIGEIQKRNGDYTDAEESIMEAIGIYEGREGPLSAELIEPYLSLGRNYDDAGDYTGAISAYSEARTIGRRNYGLLNEDQLPIIDDMTRAAVELRELDEARALQLEALTLVQRNYGETSLESIEARYKYAAWLRDMYQFDEERRYYLEILRVISRHFDDDPFMMIRAYRARAASYKAENVNDGLALSGLRESLELLEAMEDPPALTMAEIYLEMGDLAVLFSRTGAIGDDYLMAWDILGRLENGDEIRREWFEPLTVIDMGPVSRRGLSSDPDAPRGFVEIYFTVDRSGRARDVEVRDSFPPGLMDTAFIRQYRDGRFRPRIRNREFVDARRARRNEFFYDIEAAEEVLVNP